MSRSVQSQAVRVATAVTVAVLLLGGTLAGCSEQRDEAVTTDVEVPADCSVQDLLACADESSIADLVPDGSVAVEAGSDDPITIGMVNQENTPAGSYPDLSQAAFAFVDFFNEQMGGVDGRPLELEVCNTSFSAEGSTACGQRFAEAGVPVVLGGIDVFGTAIDVLEENGIPFAGGIPVGGQSMSATNSFQWSGGTWGAAVAFAKYADEELDAEKVAFVYGDFGSIAEGADAGKRELESRDIEAVMVPYPIVSTDMSSPMQAAWATEPDVIAVLAADTACGSAFEAKQTLGITASMFYVGSCAAPPITQAAGDEATEGAYFNVEGPVDLENPDPDATLYSSVLAAYAPDLDPIGAATVSARSIVNLYAVLRGLGADDISADSVMESLRAQRGTSSFNGHDYTCDRQQIPELPAACSPQQIMIQMQGGTLSQVSSWIEVGSQQ